MSSKTYEMHFVANCITAVLYAVYEMNGKGAPGSALYAGLSGHGCDLTLYTFLMKRLVEDGYLRKKKGLYYLGDRALPSADEISMAE